MERQKAVSEQLAFMSIYSRVTETLTSPEQTASLDTVDSHSSAETHCFHCGTRIGSVLLRHAEHSFCCQGCKMVYELLTESGLGEYYALDEQAGIRAPAQVSSSRFAFLDDPAVREKIVQFSDAHLTRVQFRLPSIHCVACIWLLENLFKLQPGIGRTEVNFLRREASFSFDPSRLKLSQLASLLTSLGYEPDLKFSDVEHDDVAGPKPYSTPRKLWMQLGVAGFAFGNNMLFSIAIYLGLDAFHGPSVQRLVGFISMALALPVLLYSSQDYFHLAYNGLKHKLLTIEVPIAAGILVIFAQSAYEVISGHGEGYFDSFSGLLFFLLTGRLFQQKTYSRLAFDRDFRSFFPLAIIRLGETGESSVSLSQLKVGDRLLVRNGELIPADSTITNGVGCIDYSFVTGEAEPVEKLEGDLVYAGGRQVGAAVEIEMVRPVSQSYLTSLWNQDAFTKSATDSLDTLINRYSQRFTKIILAISLATAAYWIFADASIAFKALTSVLIVACPCALALAAPFTMGSAIRVLGRSNIFVKNAEALERLAQIDTIVFDKTGTLTAAGAASIQFHGTPLSAREEGAVHALTRHSTHPYSARIFQASRPTTSSHSVRSFLEIPGCGIEGNIDGHEMALGSGQWLKSRGVQIPLIHTENGSVVHLAIDGHHRGAFALTSALRSDIQKLLGKLAAYDPSLLSGDNEKERALFEPLFGPDAELRFNQSPIDKLNFIKELQAQGKKVMMAGDGLNDAGALKQSDVGVAVVESIGAFAPASDIILAAENASRIDALLKFSKQTVRVVRLSFILSSIYNVGGIAIAAAGLLAPIVCAILMPLSSITVVAFACGATAFAARRCGISPAKHTAC
ncbi:MAG: heavy metal translocating P-type ATPase [Verrucomicrobiales bacterium]